MGQQHSTRAPFPSIERNSKIRKIVIENLLNGVSTRTIGKLVGVSHEMIARYRKQIFLPAVATAEKLANLKRELQTQSNLPTTDESTKMLTKDVLQTDPLFTRYFERADLQTVLLRKKAEVEDAKGFAAVNMAATRDDELYARLSGRLESPSGVVNMVVLMPPSTPVEQAETRQLIDIAAIEVDPPDD